MLRVKSTQNIIHTNSFLHYGKFFNQFSSGIHNFCIFKRSLYLLLKKKKILQDVGNYCESYMAILDHTKETSQKSDN